MAIKSRDELVSALAEIIHEHAESVSFCILEVGAVPVDGHAEPFHRLLDLFPESRIFAFEIDDEVCNELNDNAPPGLTFFPVALGRAEENRPFYQTAHPMSSSLYRPNEELIRQYCHMESAMLDSITSLDTVSLDRFARDNGIDDADFIKIDIQGAELDVFQGGVATLRDMVMIVSEVEFIPQYIDQPLFGDVSGFLIEQGFMFQNFSNMGRRALSPFLVNDPNKGSHFIWSDAIFIKSILRLPNLDDAKLLKMAVLATLYNSGDLAYRCLNIVDNRNQTRMADRFASLLQIAT